MKKATFSFDDGGIQDAAVLDILKAHYVHATFYLPVYRIQDMPVPRTIAAIVKQYEGHEIGCHTLTHPRMVSLTPDHLIAETGNARAWLSEAFGREIRGFAYPQGHADDAAIAAVRDAGFSWGRGCHVAPADIRKAEHRWFLPISVHCRFDMITRFRALEQDTVHFVAHGHALARESALGELDALLTQLWHDGYHMVTNSEFYEDMQ